MYVNKHKFNRHPSLLLLERIESRERNVYTGNGNVVKVLSVKFVWGRYTVLHYVNELRRRDTLVRTRQLGYKLAAEYCTYCNLNIWGQTKTLRFFKISA